MRALFINATEKTITKMELGTPLIQAMRAVIGCDLVDCASIGPALDLWIDDEGLDIDRPWIIVDGKAFAGNGLVLGVDDFGNSVDCPAYFTPAVLAHFVRFPVPVTEAEAAAEASAARIFEA